MGDLKVTVVNSKEVSAGESKHLTMNQPAKFVQVRSLYNRHFPTDKKTFNIRLPFLGFVLSVLGLYIVTTLLFRNYIYYEHSNGLIVFAYVLIAFATSYELHYGLEIGDRKQFTPWILVKFAENILIFVSVVIAASKSYGFGPMIFGIIILVINSIVTFVIVSKYWRQLGRSSQQRQNVNVDDDENIYDNFEIPNNT